MTRVSIHSRSTHRRGTILILAMIVVFALASLVLVLGQSMRVEVTASANALATEQCTAIARGAEQYVLAILTENLEEVPGMDQQYFQQVAVGSNSGVGGGVGYFWIIRPDYMDPSLPLYGLVDEAGKVDINRANRNQLIQIPGMTEEIADSILDWRDRDETKRQFGAESSDYSNSVSPYVAKNTRFETVEELMLIKGMTRDLLFGPPTDEATDVRTTGMNAGGSMNFNDERWLAHGLFDIFTCWGGESRPAGRDQRISVTGNNPQNRNRLRNLLSENLGEEYGNRVTNNSNYDNIFEMAEEVQLTSAQLEQIEDQIRGGNNRNRINVNTAPRDVLASVTGPAIASVLVDARPSQATMTNPASIAWVIDAVSAGTAAEFGDDICGRGAVYSADIVATTANGRAFKRVRVVVDANLDPPAIINRRDLTDQGWPLDMSILESLKSGQAPQQASASSSYSSMQSGARTR